MDRQKLLSYGLSTGMLFGLLLQRSGVLRYDKQVAALRFQDMTIVKFMLSAIMVSMTAFFMLKEQGLTGDKLRDTNLPANILGGLTFGAGWGLTGYCPGTAVGATGEGKLDSVFGILGMLTGAAIYAETYPKLKSTVLSWFNIGKLTVPELLNLNHWAVVSAFIAFSLSLFGLLERKNM